MSDRNQILLYTQRILDPFIQQVLMTFPPHLCRGAAGHCLPRMQSSCSYGQQGCLSHTAPFDRAKSADRQLLQPDDSTAR